MKKLYLISQNINNDYDTYSSAVVVAESEEEARMIRPCGYGEVSLSPELELYDSWAPFIHIHAEYLGDAKESETRKIICASFHTG